MTKMICNKFKSESDANFVLTPPSVPVSVSYPKVNFVPECFSESTNTNIRKVQIKLYCSRQCTLYAKSTF